MIAMRQPMNAAEQVSRSSIRLITTRDAIRPHLRPRGIVTATHGDLLMSRAKLQERPLHACRDGPRINMLLAGGCI